MIHPTHPGARPSVCTSKALGLALLTSLALAGCGTTTVMHYDLTAATAAGAPSVATTSTTTTINYRLQNVTVPEPLDVMTLMVRQPNNSLMVLSHDKWVASLGQVMRQAIADGLTRELGVPPLTGQMTTNDTGRSGRATAEVTAVTVDVQRFEMQPAKQATLNALWQVVIPEPARVTITCFSQLSEPVDSGVAPLVTAQQANVSRLTQQIARVVATARAVTDARCQVLTP